MAKFLVDTNFLLQCKSADELAWSDVTTDPEILLMVPEPVQEEVDRLKQDGSSRRSSRARAANGIFRKILGAAGLVHVFRERGPRVAMTLVDRLQPTPDLAIGLDLGHADDRILATARVLRTKGEDVQVLTGDTGMILAARRHDVPCVGIPEEGWLLPPEHDKQSKELVELRRQLEALRRSAPELSLLFKRSSEPIDRLEVAVVDYDSDDAVIERAVAEIKARYPMKTEFFTTPLGRPPSALDSLFGQPRWKPPSEMAIRKYQEDEYPKWLGTLASYFKGVLANRAAATRILEIRAVLENVGTKPAENVVLDIEAIGGIKLSPRGSPRPDATRKLPTAPEAPTGSWEATDQFGILSHLGDSGRDYLARGFNPMAGVHSAVPPARDRYAFYWSPDAPSVVEVEWRLVCVEFRHQLDPRSFSIPIYVPEDCAAGPKAIRVRASASNIPTPLTAVLPIVVDFERRAANEVIEEILEPGRPRVGLRLGTSEPGSTEKGS